MTKLVTCYIGIGSNLGNRRENIKLAIAGIKDLKNTRVLKVSSLMETLPVAGPKGQPKFLNSVAKISTQLSPLGLLRKFKEIEQALGRKKSVRNGARCIDLDILLYADRIINHKKLRVPHSRMFERDFVLQPLLEVI